MSRYVSIHVVSGNKYLPRGSNLSITITGNITMSKEAVQVVTMLFLDFVMIHLNSLNAVTFI